MVVIALCIAVIVLVLVLAAACVVHRSMLKQLRRAESTAIQLSYDCEYLKKRIQQLTGSRRAVIVPSIKRRW